MSQCRDCGASIVFVRMRAGTVVPCDPVPDERGNVAAMRTTGRTWVDGYVLSKVIPLVEPSHRLLMPHRATCGGRLVHPAGRRQGAAPDQPALIGATA